VDSENLTRRQQDRTGFTYVPKVRLWMTFHGVLASFCVTLLSWAALGVSYVKVIEVRPYCFANTNVGCIIYFLTTHNLWRYFQRLQRYNALKKGTPSKAKIWPIEYYTIECMYVCQYSLIRSDTRSIAPRGHLSDIWAPVFSFQTYTDW